MIRPGSASSGWAGQVFRRHRIVEVATLIGRELGEVGPHLMADRRVQRGFQRGRAVEEDAVALEDLLGRAIFQLTEE